MAGRKVTTSRIGRFGVLSKLAGGIATGVMTEASKQWVSGNRPALKDLVLTPRNLERMGKTLSELRGAAMKLGQLLSMDSGNVLPPELSELLSSLRSDATHLPLGETAKVLKANWGDHWDQQFQRFNFTPVAAASIGQVHYAELKDGRRVAVKLQYPGIRKSIDSDIDNVAMVLRWSGLLPEGLDLSPLLDEAKQQLHTEADYLLEAQHLRDYVERTKEIDYLEVPEVLDKLTTEHVLVMDWLDGKPIDALVNEPTELRNEMGNRLLSLAVTEVFEWGTAQTDPNFANYLYDADRRVLQLLDFGATRVIPDALQHALKQLLTACLENNQQAIHHSACQVGYLDSTDPEPYAHAINQMIELATSPLRMMENVNFRQLQIADELQELVVDLRLKQKFYRLPPTDVLFLHRKLGGLYLTLQKINADLPVRPIVSSFANAA
jgi:predicted unusual protein kinase regulating ubiquinone biosynthesis (AarF/ABC1/UbiB family)